MGPFEFKRRGLLQAATGGVATLALSGPKALVAQGLTPPTLTIILLDRGLGGVDQAARDGAVSAFSKRALPLGFAQIGDSQVTGSPGRRAAPELALWHLTGVTLPRYFQARTLSEARNAMRRARPGQKPPTFMVAPDPGQPLALAGLGPTGLRCAFLVPETSTPAWVESHPARIVAARGGHLARLADATSVEDAITAARAYLADAMGDPLQVHASLYIDLAGPVDAVMAMTEALADEIAGRNDDGYLVPLAPGELPVRHAQGFERVIGLRLDPPNGTPADDPALAGLTTALDGAGIAYSVARDDPALLAATDAIRLDPANVRAEGVTGAARGWHTATVSPPDPAIAPALANAGIMAATGAGPEGWRGLDGNALLHLAPELVASTAAEIEAGVDALRLSEDAVLAIDTRTAAVPVQRNALVVALRQIAAVPGTRIVDLAEFTRLVGATDPIATTLRRTRAMAPEIAPRAASAPSPDERAALLDDARRAWSYFEAVTHDNTGLPDTTVVFNQNGTPAIRLDMLTQWDTGSVIFAWIAALELEFISRAAFNAWGDKVLDALTTTTLSAPHLPRAIFHAGAPWRGNGDFNVCDAGRLLTALHALSIRRPEGDTGVGDLVASWDLAEAVIDGVPHSFDRGTFRAGDDTHCSSYIKRGFALWGIETRSLYDAYYRGATEADAAMHLLQTVADIGTLGAEPLLMETLEYGADPPERVLIDVLMAAQIDEWHARGTLVAPSEGPLDRPPWFTYQGIRLDRTGQDRWDVISLTPGGATPTPAFRDAHRMVTCKAPFLWATAHPHPYCDKLLAYARAHGKMTHGFASGIYTATDTPTLNYGDVNTNGVILEAIATRLGVM